MESAVGNVFALADICIARGVGAAQRPSHLSQSPGQGSLPLPISQMMSFWFWLELEVPVQPSALGTQTPPHGQALRGTNLAMAGGDNQEIRLQGPTSEVQPTPEKPPQGTL